MGIRIEHVYPERFQVVETQYETVIGAPLAREDLLALITNAIARLRPGREERMAIVAAAMGVKP